MSEGDALWDTKPRGKKKRDTIQVIAVSKLERACIKRNFLKELNALPAPVLCLHRPESTNRVFRNMPTGKAGRRLLPAGFIAKAYRLKTFMGEIEGE